VKEELQKLIDNIKSDLTAIPIERDILIKNINVLYSFINKNSLWVQSFQGNYTNRVLSKIMESPENNPWWSLEQIEILHEGILDIIKYRGLK